MGAVELQRSSEEHRANAVLRAQTEQRTASLLQAPSCALLQCKTVRTDNVMAVRKTIAATSWAATEMSELS